MKLFRILPVVLALGLAVSPAVFAAAAPSPCSADMQYALSHPTYDFQNPLKGFCLPELIANIIAQLLTLSGALFLGMFLWGGISYMTAGGDKSKVEKAQKMLKNAIIGMAIIVGARLAMDWVLTTAGGIATPNTGTGT